MQKAPFSSYRIRFNDCDPFGHLNNARYLDYFLNAREDHLRLEYGLELTDYYKKGTAWLVVEHEINYLKPASYNEMVVIKSSLLKAGPDYLLVEMIMTDEMQSHIKSVMWTKFVPVDPKTGRRSSHPAVFMEFAQQIVRTDVNESSLKERLKALYSK